ncbi:MAG TPA: ABC transporter permease subunit [Desulfobaccales bacterium]|nr:ABC transporter permease subunit [Desulfobaccales bacterium]
MSQPSRLFQIARPLLRPLTWGDAVVFLGLALLFYLGIHLGLRAPSVIKGPEINLAPRVLPYYVGLSLGRMVAAYILSILFSLAFGYLAARSRTAEKFLIPLLDVLQSMPILSFLPIALLSLSAILPIPWAVELSSIILIFTSQAWNIGFAWYQSLTTIPRNLRQASTIFKFNGWLRFKTLELPFAAISLIWNSMASWAGGWFFLMASEIFSVGHRNFRLPGLGAYLQEAANQGSFEAIAWGLAALILTIVILDQLVWRPLLAWSERFTMSLVESPNPPTSWFYEALRSSRILHYVITTVFEPPWRWLDERLSRSLAAPAAKRPRRQLAWIWYMLLTGAALAALYGLWLTVDMLWTLPLQEWGEIALGTFITLLRVIAALVIALGWTIPVGVAIGSNPRLSTWLQPMVQIAASLPATALFPILLLLVLGLPGGLNLAAILLMLLGTQWYLLFNIIAGASAIPRELRYTSDLLQLSRWERWRSLILPAIFPYTITGAIAAGGGAWNASVVAEYTQFGGKTFHTIGVGALIAEATGAGNFALLLASTLALILTVVLINRFFWQRLYRLAEERYRME